MIIFEGGGSHFSRQCSCGHLPPPPLLKHYPNNSVVVSPCYVKLSLVRHVRVHEELLLLGLHVFILAYFLIFESVSAEIVLLSVCCFTEGVSWPLLGWHSCRHVWSYHAILFVQYLVETYQDSFFGADLKLTGLESLQIAGNSVRHGNFEVVAKLLDLF